jgi:hypothetical protein
MAVFSMAQNAPRTSPEGLTDLNDLPTAKCWSTSKFPFNLKTLWLEIAAYLNGENEKESQ